MAIRINKPLTAMTKYYARKRYKEVFDLFDKEATKIIKKLELPNRRTPFGAGRVDQLRELQFRGRLAQKFIKTDLQGAQEIYAEIAPLIKDPEAFREQITAARVGEYTAMAERVNPGDGDAAAILFEQMSPEMVEDFFQSPEFVPIRPEPSPEGSLGSYIEAEGESPVITRLKEFATRAF